MPLKINSQFALINKSLTVGLTWLLLSGIFLSCLQTFGSPKQKTADLVYCPLVKAFLKKNLSIIKLKEPLKDVCATERQKELFFFEMAKRQPLLRFVSDSAEMERIFFDYLKKGKSIFSASCSRTAPQSESSLRGKKEKTAGFSSFQIDKHQLAAHFTFPHCPRPPSVVQNPFYTTESTPRIKTISRRLQPRAPPASTV